jgi:HlyD family secretion protein
LDLAVREAQASVDDAERRFRESFAPESMVTGAAPSEAVRHALMHRAGLVAARLHLERAQLERDRADLRAPMAGVVDAVDVAVGDQVGMGQPLLTVVDLRHVRVEAHVLEHDLPLLHVGADARVSTSGASDRLLRGRVGAVLPLVDSASRAGRAIVRLAGDGTLRPGMFADVELETVRLRSRRLVPTRAIIERDGRPLVFVVRDGRAQWTYIVPGRTNGRDTEVLPDSATREIPVQPGDRVIVEGHLTLTHDAPVTVAPTLGVPATVHRRTPHG